MSMKLNIQEQKKVFELIAEIEDDVSVIKEKFVNQETGEILNLTRFNRRLEILMNNVRNILEISSEDYKNMIDSKSYFSKSQKSFSNLGGEKETEDRSIGVNETFEAIFSEILKRENRIISYQNKKTEELVEKINEEIEKTQEKIEKELEKNLKEIEEIAQQTEENCGKIDEVSSAIKAQLMGIKANEDKKSERLKENIFEVSEKTEESINKSKRVKKIFKNTDVSVTMIKNIMRNSVKVFPSQKSIRSIRSRDFAQRLRTRISMANYPLKENFKKNSHSLLSFSDENSFILVKRETGYCIFQGTFPKSFQEFNNYACYCSGFYFIYNSKEKLLRVDEDGENLVELREFKEGETDFGYALRSCREGNMIAVNSCKKFLRIFSVEESGDIVFLIEIPLKKEDDFIQDFRFMGENEILVVTENGDVLVFSLNLEEKKAEISKKIDLKLFDKNMKVVSAQINQDNNYIALSATNEIEEENTLILLKNKEREILELEFYKVEGIEECEIIRALQFQEKKRGSPEILTVIPESKKESHIMSFEVVDGKFKEIAKERQKLWIKHVRKLSRIEGGKLYGVGGDSKFIHIEHVKS